MWHRRLMPMISSSHTHVISYRFNEKLQLHWVAFFSFKLKQQTWAYANFFLVHTGLCSETPLEEIHKSRYNYVSMALMVKSKNEDCLGFKTLPAAQQHGARFKANCTLIFQLSSAHSPSTKASWGFRLGGDVTGMWLESWQVTPIWGGVHRLDHNLDGC